MQQFITSAKACELLDRVLQTVQTLNQTRELFFGNALKIVPTAGPIVLPTERMSVAPVLTIKLADLVREGAEARERRNQHSRPQRPVNKPRQQQLLIPRKPHFTRELRAVEILYKRTHKLAS